LVELMSGDQQLAFAGEELKEPLAVRVTRGGVPVPHLGVRWRIIEGGGAIDEPLSHTDSAGLASVRVIMPLEGTQVLVLAEAEGSSATFRLYPTRVFSFVGAGYGHTCALSTTGHAYCWGRNDKAQLGDGSETERTTPVPVRLGLQFEVLAVGWFHTCGLVQSGQLFCWGDNGSGQLGVGDLFLRHAPTPVASEERFVAVSAGYLHTCGITLDGTLLCWGADDHAQSGLPRMAEGATAFTRVAAGEFHSCALALDGAAYCWGFNGDGELGTGAAFGTTEALPQAVAGGLQFTDIVAHSRHTCALATDGTAYCWGRNGTGETGQDRFFRTRTPLPVSSALFQLISTGDVYSCGVQVTSVAACWGSQAGEDGDFKVPSAIAGLADVSLVSVGFAHTCAVAAFQIWCWGDNSSRQLGVPTSQGSLTPVRVVFPP
jgi:alpha-tubulin suppressor-like RCC1 family protein